MPWRCFMVEPSEFGRRSLRRYGGTCPLPHGYHDVEAVVDEQIPAADDECGGRERDAFRDSPLWPKVCACGQVLHPEGNWQVNVDRLYKGAPDGKLYRLRDLPPGAIWRATWMEDIRDNPYANDAGEVWAMMLPGGDEWLIYSKVGPEKKRWDIQGQLPQITVSPSIWIRGKGSYHGYVQNGIVTEDCEGRAFPGLARTA